MIERLILQLRRSDLWETVYFNNFLSAGFVGQKPIPIPEAYVPITLTTPIAAIYCSSFDPKASRWQRGCKVSQVTPIGANIGSGFGAVTQTKIVSLNVPTLLFFPLFTDEYALLLEFYPWFREVQVSVHQYIGEVTDTTTEALENIQTSLNTITQRMS